MTTRSCSSWVDSPDERRLWLAAGISEVQDQGEVAVVNGHARDIDDASDALLQLCELYRRGPAGFNRPTLDSSDSWNMVIATLCMTEAKPWAREDVVMAAEVVLR